jgi:hypothetical protein
MDGAAVKAFLSYSHESPEHVKRVRELGDLLRRDGIEANLDQYEASPPEGWPIWMDRAIQEAQYVLVICTKTYRDWLQDPMPRQHGRGVRWESRLIYQDLYENGSRNHKYIPVTFEGTTDYIPRPLKDSTHYDLSTEEGYFKLLRRLQGMGAAVRPPLGQLTGATSPEVLATAVAEYKAAAAASPDIRKLDLSALAGIHRGPHERELDLLSYAVAPSLCEETDEDKRREAELWSKIGERNLEPAERQQLEQELRQLEHARWRHDRGGRSPLGEPIPFAVALSRYRRLTIIGDPGTGKSVLTRLAFLACDEGEIGERARRLLAEDVWFAPPESERVSEAVEELRGLLPVHLTLSGFGSALEKQRDLSLEDMLHRQLRERGAPEELLAGLGQLLSAGRLFVLCDALDEAAEPQRRLVVDRVSEFAYRYPRVRLLVTSRPQGYHPWVRGIEHTRLAPLDRRKQRLLVQQIHHLVETHRRSDARHVERARRRTQALLNAIDTQEEWTELSSNPLLLTLSALTPTGEDDVPRHRVFVFENFIRTLAGEWRSVLGLSRSASQQLIAAWSAVASKLLLQEEGHGTARLPFLRLLAEALSESPMPAPLSAERALHLALETGLVRTLEDDSVVFWHKTFAEFLAARALAGDGTGAAKRLLAKVTLPQQVLRLAAAQLQYVCRTGSEVDELAEELLARDEEGPGRMLRPGLRAVSACLAERVRLSPALTELVWTAWAGVLERTPPSPLWRDFIQLIEHAPSRDLTDALFERFATIPDRNLGDVQRALARLIAPAAARAPVARTACRRWIQQTSGSTSQLYGASGLAAAGEWTDAVIDILGQFGSSRILKARDVGRWVRQGGAPLLDRLRELVRTRLRSEVPPLPAGQEPAPESSPHSQEEEKVLRDRRLSAACLLAAADEWADDVAKVLELTLEGRNGQHRDRETVDVVRACARHEAVQRSLLEWMVRDSQLGSHARDVIRDVAAEINGLPEQVLERAVTAKDSVRSDLESLLVSIGREQRAFTTALWSWLEDEREERSMCAARLLCTLEPRDGRLHAVLRRWLGAQDEARRARWAHLAFGLDSSLDGAAMEVLLSCACSPDRSVRKAVHENLYELMRNSRWASLDRWLAIANNPSVPAVARFDAVKLLTQSPRREELVPGPLRQLLDVDDAEVRRRAASWLVEVGLLDERTAVIAAEEAARVGDQKLVTLWLRRNAQPFAAAVVAATLRGLSAATTVDSKREELWMNWFALLTEFVEVDPSSVSYLLDALGQPGWAGILADQALYSLGVKLESTRSALRARLDHAAGETNRPRLLALIIFGLRFEETCPSALAASQLIHTRSLTQPEAAWLSPRLYQAGATRDAARLWRLVVDGEELELVLQATEALVVRCPEEVGAWLQPVLDRLLDSQNLSHRVDAARIALRCGLLEDRATAALLGCLSLADHQYRRFFGFHGPWRSEDARAIASGPAGDDLLEAYLATTALDPRLDFEAMYALCVYQPAVGMPKLAEWLHDADGPRFGHAVPIFAARDRNSLRAALTHRLRSAPERQLEYLTLLVDRYGLYSQEMAEQLLARFTRGLPTYEPLERCLAQWWKHHPDIWNVFWKESPERRADFERLLRYDLPVTREAVAFLVESVVSPLSTESPHFFEFLIKRWCQPPKNEEGEQKAEQKLAPPPIETVRGWLSDVLAGLELPADLHRLLCLDKLIELSGLPSEERVEVLRRALDIDVAALMRERQEVQHLPLLQAEAALHLHALKIHDERILPILEKVALAPFTGWGVFGFELEVWRALLSLRPNDAALRQPLIHALLIRKAPLPLKVMLELLTQAGLSEAERMEVLLATFDLGSRPAWLEALRPNERHPAEPRDEDKPHWAMLPELLDTLQTLGCEPERRTTLLREFMSKHGMELPISTGLQLVTHPDLPAPDAVKWVLSAAARTGWDAREAEEHWMKHFASQRGNPEEKGTAEEEETDDDRWWHYGESNSLWMRLRSLARLSEVKDPALVEGAVAELAAVSASQFLPLYHRLGDGDVLSDAEWMGMLQQLTPQTSDTYVTLFAKEWLMLGLWQAADPSTSRWLHHP